MCTRRITRWRCRNPASDPEESIYGEMNPIYTYSGCPWITLDNSKESNYKYANECIFINGIFRTGDAYGLRDLHELRRKELATPIFRSEEHTSELQSRLHLVCRLLFER